MKKLINYLHKYWIFLVLILFSSTPLIWFLNKSEYIINGIDTNFPLNPLDWFQKRLFVWNSDLNGGIDFSSSQAGLFFHFIQVVPYSLGIGLHFTQIFSFLFWFGLIVFSSYYFIKTILKNNFSHLVFVCLYTFNIYMFNSWENVKVANLSLIAGIPIFLGIYTNYIKGKYSLSTTILIAIFCGIVLSGSGINPAYFATFLIVSFIYCFVTIGKFSNDASLFTIFGKYLILIGVIITVNFYWILPSAHFIGSAITPGNSIENVGFNNWVDSLSVNSSILNILRLQGAWDWYTLDSSGMPLYIPYASNYFNNIAFIGYSFLLVALVMFSTLFRNRLKRNFYIIFGGMYVLGVFLGVGTHEPTGKLFGFLIDYVPFFSLFRSPWYIFTPLVTISFSVLIALLVEKLSSFDKIKNYNVGPIFPLMVTILILGNLFYCYPLVTGKIFRPSSTDGFYIKFPDYVLNSVDQLKGKDSLDRILSYPDDEIEKFSWKYRGVESILELISNREFLFMPLNAVDSPVARMAKNLYFYLKTGQIEHASVLADKLNVHTIFEKNDQLSLSPALPESIKNYKVDTYGNWNFYQYPGISPSKIYSPSKIILGKNKIEENLKSIILTKSDEVFLNQQDINVLQIDGLKSSSGQILTATNSQQEDLAHFNNLFGLEGKLLSKNISSVNYSINIDENGNFTPILEARNLQKFGIDIRSNLDVNLNGSKVTLEVLKIENQFIYYKDIYLSKGENTINIPLVDTNLIVGGDFKNSSLLKQITPTDYQIYDSNGEKYLSILNHKEVDAEIDFPVTEFDPSQKYIIQVKYKQIYGNNAKILITQRNKDTLFKVQSERLPNNPEWNLFSVYFQPVLTQSGLDIGLVSPSTHDVFGTTIWYKDLEVYRVFDNNLFFKKDSNIVNISLSHVTFKKDSPVHYSGNVKNDGGQHIIVFSENYSPDWEFKIKSNSNVIPQPVHFSANLYANAWYVKNAPESYDFEIYYKPQRLFSVGVVISGLSIILILGLNIIRFFKRRNN